LESGFIQDPASEFPRIPLPRTPVNKSRRNARVVGAGGLRD
jgi:hypothetical protein